MTGISGYGACIVYDYCERGMSSDFWGEPVNAVTNGAFLAAALWALYEARSRGRLDRLSGLLCANLAAIGVGSFLFHTLATRWAYWADVLPIGAIVLLYFGAILVRAHRVSCSQAALCTLAFALATTGFVYLVGATSIGKANAAYMAAWLLIVGNAAALGWRGHELAPWLCAGAGIFLTSIAMRMADHSVCACLPIGTHFLWHLLNGALFGVLLTGYVRHCPRVNTGETTR